jgi:hypothetical protein
MQNLGMRERCFENTRRQIVEIRKTKRKSIGVERERRGWELPEGRKQQGASVVVVVVVVDRVGPSEKLLDPANDRRRCPPMGVSHSALFRAFYRTRPTPESRTMVWIEPRRVHGQLYDSSRRGKVQ